MDGYALRNLDETLLCIIQVALILASYLRAVAPALVADSCSDARANRIHPV